MPKYTIGIEIDSLLQPKVVLYVKLLMTHLFFTPFDEAFYNLKQNATE